MPASGFPITTAFRRTRRRHGGGSRIAASSRRSAKGRTSAPRTASCSPTARGLDRVPILAGHRGRSHMGPGPRRVDPHHLQHGPGSPNGREGHGRQVRRRPEGYAFDRASDAAEALKLMGEVVPYLTKLRRSLLSSGSIKAGESPLRFRRQRTNTAATCGRSSPRRGSGNSRRTFRIERTPIPRLTAM